MDISQNLRVREFETGSNYTLNKNLNDQMIHWPVHINKNNRISTVLQLLTIPVSLQLSPDTVMWLWERLIGFRGLLRAISADVLGDCFTISWSPDDSVLDRSRPASPAPLICL